jgi:hypothetical protein
MLPEDMQDIPDGARIRLTVEGKAERNGLSELVLIHAAGSLEELRIQAVEWNGVFEPWMQAVTHIEILSTE